MPNSTLDQRPHHSRRIRRRRDDLTAAQADEPGTLARRANLVEAAPPPERDQGRRAASQPLVETRLRHNPNDAVVLQLGQAGPYPLAHNNEGRVIGLQPTCLGLGMDDIEGRQRMVDVFKQAHDQPDDFALLGAVLGRVSDDPVRVCRRVEEADRGINMIEVADDLLLFGADALQERCQFAALLNMVGDGVGTVEGDVLHGKNVTRTTDCVSSG